MLLEDFTTDAGEREKANARPVDGRFPEFAREVRRLLGYDKREGRPFLTSRMVSRKTEINHATVTTMVRGDRPSYQTILRLARGLNGDLDKLLRLAGYEETGLASDPLSRIGRDVDPGQFSRLPLATGTASAGGEALTAGPEETEQLGDVIRGDVRTICVDGDCMEPFFRNGDILFVQRSDTAENGQAVVAVFNGESVACKVYRNTDEGEFLEATNGKYPKITGDFRIVGIVKGSYRP